MALVYLVITMAIVTYIPRMLPLVLLQHVSLPSYVNRFMGFIPYAALGALIFPGVLHSTGDNHLESAIMGCIIAIVLALFRCNLVIVVMGGIVGAFVVNVFFK